jgi:hypothetical protein
LHAHDEIIPSLARWRYVGVGNDDGHVWLGGSDGFVGKMSMTFFCLTLGSISSDTVIFLMGS